MKKKLNSLDHLQCPNCKHILTIKLNICPFCKFEYGIDKLNFHQLVEKNKINVQLINIGNNEYI